MLGLKPSTAGELALRFMARRGRGDWAVLVADPTRARSVAEELAAEMESLGQVDVDIIVGARDAPDLAGRVGATARPLVLTGLDDWPPSEWTHLDEIRSRIARDERTALVLSYATFERIMQSAPNLSSWLGASAWTYKPDVIELTESEREARLTELRSWAGRTDADVIGLAERGQLPVEPEYAEWLVLLRRGDLLGR